LIGIVQLNILIILLSTDHSQYLGLDQVGKLRNQNLHQRYQHDVGTTNQGIRVTNDELPQVTRFEGRNKLNQEKLGRENRFDGNNNVLNSVSVSKEKNSLPVIDQARKHNLLIKSGNSVHFKDGDIKYHLPQKKNSAGPSIAWLMSYPNSGTSFTIHMTRELSNTTTATNYGGEGEIRDKPSTPIYADGPFLELIPGRTTELPTSYILTKTHCNKNSYCVYCSPNKFVLSPDSFVLGCRSGRKLVWKRDDNGKVNKMEVIRINTSYKLDEVKKAVHMIRDPFDNLVSRFHNRYNAAVQTNSKQSEKFIHNFPNNIAGFQAWCESIDKNNEKLGLEDQLNKAIGTRLPLKNIPCISELFRYVQWHNHAFSVIKYHKIDSLIVHYEEYENHYDDVVNNLFSFLELSRQRKERYPFDLGKSYKDYYEKEQILHFTKAAQKISSAETWEHLKRYF